MLTKITELEKSNMKLKDNKKNTLSIKAQLLQQEIDRRTTVEFQLAQTRNEEE